MTIVKENSLWNLQNLKKAQLNSLIAKSSPFLQEKAEHYLLDFLKYGFPTRQHEEWRYTNTSAITELNFKIASPVYENKKYNIDNYLIDETIRLVFIDGVFQNALSNLDLLPPEVILTTSAVAFEKYFDLYSLLEESNKKNSVFSSLNYALMTDGVFLFIPAHIQLISPIHLLFLNTEHSQLQMYHPRHVFCLEENSSAIIFEEYVGISNSCYFNNVVTKIQMGKESNLQYYKLQRDSKKSFHIAMTQILQQQGSQLKAGHIAIGGQLGREDLHFSLQGTRAQCDLYGFYSPCAEQHLDYHTYIDHLEPKTISKQCYKGLLMNGSRAVFNGKILVRPFASKVNAQQRNNNLLLGNQAEIDAKPELEIYNDDVRCSHGATIGQLSEDVLFYLRSRGIEKTMAKQLLTYAFAEEILAEFTVAPINGYVRNQLIRQLQRIYE